ncbi:MAG: T9SS type A sorting domain-containing protein [Flavobacteriales bacterium]|nr:T9SS type A sorting domain-containing protein [Flavobacteriales bacterium]MCC6936945.1 T9SS type A sorting domain-containing protein [Flavobacteriales bacterium]
MKNQLTLKYGVTKGLFLIGALLAPSVMHAQFDLEHTYVNASVSSSPETNELLMVDLEASGMKYVLIDRTNMALNFFHLDHTFWKSVSFSMAMDLNPNYNDGMGILYISEHLFDLDDDIEFMYTHFYPAPTSTVYGVTQIIDEGTDNILFTAEEQVPAVFVTIHQQQYPIYNTPAGTKMILSGTHGDPNAYVYSLTGTLTTSLPPAVNEITSIREVEIFPNPTNSTLTLISRSLNSSTQIEIVDQLGNLIRAIRLRSQYETIDVSQLASGNYIYQVRNETGVVGSGTFVKY